MQDQPKALKQWKNVASACFGVSIFFASAVAAILALGGLYRGRLMTASVLLSIIGALHAVALIGIIEMIASVRRSGDRRETWIS